MKRLYRNYKKSKRQRKYNEFKNSSKIFSESQVNQLMKRINAEDIKKRIGKINAIQVMQFGERIAERLATYPNVNVEEIEWSIINGWGIF